MYENIDFNVPEWGEISPNARDLVSKLLEKDPAYRITIP